jgi:hypothetical protein
MSGVPRETSARVDVVLGWGRAADSERQGNVREEPRGVAAVDRGQESEEPPDSGRLFFSATRVTEWDPSGMSAGSSSGRYGSEPTMPGLEHEAQSGQRGQDPEDPGPLRLELQQRTVPFHTTRGWGNCADPDRTTGRERRE